MIDVRRHPLRYEGRHRRTYQDERERREARERENVVDPRDASLSWERKRETARTRRERILGREREREKEGEIGIPWEEYSEGRIDDPGN